MYTPKSKKVAMVDWRFIHYSRCILGEGFRIAALCGRRSSWIAVYLHHTPKIQDVTLKLSLEWNVGLSAEDAVFYLGVSTWTVERYPRGDANIFIKRILLYLYPEVPQKLYNAPT